VILSILEKEMEGISIPVDRLTESIEDAETGERHETALLRVQPEQAHTIKKSHWLFDWHWEIKQPEREIYKFVKVVEPRVIRGLVSLEDMGNPLHLHLIENAKANRLKNKKYLGVAGNLFAFACKRSFELGYEGFITFDSKTNLVNHYIRSFGSKATGRHKAVFRYGSCKRACISVFPR
jgi:hypothetical protein